MNPTIDKYTDQHVRDDRENLARIALAYLVEYTGDFSYLVELRNSVLCGPTLRAAHDLLSIAQVRGVLNCMRADPRSPKLPVPVRQEATVLAFDPDRLRKEKRNQRLKSVPSRFPFSLKVKWRYDFAITDHPRSYVVHMINHERSGIKYFPAIQEYQVHIQWKCGHDPRRGNYDPMNGIYDRLRNYDHLEFLSEGDATALVMNTSGWKMCKACALKE